MEAVPGSLRMNIFSRKPKNDRDNPITSIAITGKTDVGKVRKGNEDSYGIVTGEDAPDGIQSIVVVADGMGGHAAGEVASEMTVKGVLELLKNTPLNNYIQSESYSELLKDILNQVNKEVYDSGQKPEYQGMGTTCTMGVLIKGNFYLANVGDSRAYRMRKGKLTQITRDHSWVFEQTEAGNITVEDAKTHPYRNIVTRSIGTGEKVQPDTFIEKVIPGDKFLFCSDGLNSVTDDKEIEDNMKIDDLDALCDALINVANSKGGPDNITVVVAKIDEIKPNK